MDSRKLLSSLDIRTKLAMLLDLSALAVILSISFGAVMLGDRMSDDRVDKLRAVTQSAMGIGRGL